MPRNTWVTVCYTDGTKKQIPAEKATHLIDSYETNEKIIGFVSNIGEDDNILNSLLDAVADDLYYQNN